MRRIRYSVAMSLDGYIAGPKGEADWIIMDPVIDFGALLSQFDTILVGRRTFEPLAHAGRTTMPGMKTVVSARMGFSRISASKRRLRIRGSQTKWSAARASVKPAKMSRSGQSLRVPGLDSQRRRRGHPPWRWRGPRPPP